MAGLSHEYTAPASPNDKRPTRVCQQCGTDSTAQWRYGHNGSFLMCNACGIRWRRKNHTQEKRRRPGPRPPTSGSYRLAHPLQSSPIRKFRHQHYTPRFHTPQLPMPSGALASLRGFSPFSISLSRESGMGRRHGGFDSLLTRVPSSPIVPPLSTSPVSSQSAYPIVGVVPAPKLTAPSTSSPLSIRNLLNNEEDGAPVSVRTPEPIVPYYSAPIVPAGTGTSNYSHYYC